MHPPGLAKTVAMGAATGDLELLRAYEPILRLTGGEYYLPVAVDGYVSRCTLWEHESDESERALATPGQLDLEALARLGIEHRGKTLSLSSVVGGATRGRRERFLVRLRAVRPEFQGVHRLAQVGLLGRLIDTASRVSLLWRGAVPGGSALSAWQVQRAHLEASGPAYYGRVLRDEPWIVLQYWYFYTFNNWRSGYSGVNEHEGDWEQVTIYLDGTEPQPGLPPPRWVVYSAHDETGDDLRRRWDDPDLLVVDGAHPVVFVGAGSHSGAYLPGDYLITVEPPQLGGVLPVLRKVAKVFTPWTRAAQGHGLGIPYVDYARGDGLSIGTGGDLQWNALLIDDSTPWVRDYQGLWGHDTHDRLGGERGPAGPRYERNGAIRESWGDPVGWSGLGKVSPNPSRAVQAVERRIAEIDAEIGQLQTSVEAGRRELVSRSVGRSPVEASRGGAETEARLHAERMTEVRLRDERDALTRAVAAGLPAAGPHDHLRHRRVPIETQERARERVLGGWSVVSTPLMLLTLAWLAAPTTTARGTAAVLSLALVLSVEAFARGFFGAFVRRVVFALVVVNVAQFYVVNWQWASTGLFAALALTVLIVNLRDAIRR